MKIVYFTHSLRSCWNHGNAHFLRGVLHSLQILGHEVVALEPAGAWSVANLLQDHGEAGLQSSGAAYPTLRPVIYNGFDELEQVLSSANLVLAHEWNEPALVAHLGRIRSAGGPFTLLFHDTHHRAVSDPEAMLRYDLEYYDGVLAFGETLARVYQQWGWGDRVWVWHEAADVTRFHPPVTEVTREGLVWVGNWGDGERTLELRDFLFQPARAAGLELVVYGVRYPPEALATLQDYGASYRGWLPNAGVPDVFARHLATVHIPRRFYVEQLPGIPTIRVFEALACGIPLVCAPWQDSEHLFRPGQDYLVANTGIAMQRHLIALTNDPALRAALTASGLDTIRSRHTCLHRAQELLGIVGALRGHQIEHAA